MTYNYKDRKIVALLAENLETWQAMNALGHMAAALGSNKDAELMGRSVLVDKSNNSHLGIPRFGFIIKKADSLSIAETLKASNSQSIIKVDFPREMLDTSHDDELVESIKLKSSDEFEYLGAIFYGPTSEIDALTKRFKLWS